MAQLAVSGDNLHIHSAIALVQVSANQYKDNILTSNILSSPKIRRSPRPTQREGRERRECGRFLVPDTQASQTFNLQKELMYAPIDNIHKPSSINNNYY